MFLRPLNNEQKELFLNLALAAASANSVIEESEKALLAAYADEMGVDVSLACVQPVEDICTKLKSVSNSKQLNQIMFEIVGMIASDNEYDNQEKNFIMKLSEIFEIPMDRIDEMFICVNEYTSLIKKINICYINYIYRSSLYF